MLQQLKLNNLALSVQADVDFTPGMICITGETGAGKSLVVDALGLVLGGKSDVNMVRQGTKQLEVAGVFSIDHNPKAQALLSDFGFSEESEVKSKSNNKDNDMKQEATVLEQGEFHVSTEALSVGQNAVEADGHAIGLKYSGDDEVILRRIITSEGKSKSYVNGHIATLSQLRQIGECLVAIHGQHASVKLIDEKNQLEIVDNFGSLKDLVNQCNQAFNQYSKLRSELVDLSNQQKQGASVYRQTHYDLEELRKLDLKEGDYENIEAMFDKAMNMTQFYYAVGNLRNVIDSSENGIISILRDRQSELDKVKAFDPNIVKILEELEMAIMHLDDCSALAEDLTMQSIEMSAEELEAKMSKIHNLARRFSCTPHDLYLMRETLESKVNEFLGLKDLIAQKTEKVKESRAIYESLCDELSKKRQEVSKELAAKICDKITSLALPDARFDIVMSTDHECRPRLNGRDNLCFMFSANLGQELKPLSAVASGGELSRLALSIEVLTASVKSTPTLIFDEVDTGISGRTASAVGSLLKELGKYVQVITVTHLPQVAAKANTQFVVSKFNEDGQVNSIINKLDASGRIEEISRMIGGSTITETTRKSAFELLNEF